MILFPAIDLKGGQCVRLQKGDMARATVFNTDPAAQARDFERQGFEYLHVVDLDGAFAGRSMNASAIEAILAAIKIPLQLGGGIRDIAAIEAWLGRGVTRVIIGTGAVRDPALVRQAARLYPGRVAVGIDARDGKVAVEGWAISSELPAAELGKRFEDAGVAAIVYTDIARDGLLKGLNIEATLALAKELSIPVTVSYRKEPLDPRAFELVNKTNQFNLNGKRFSEVEWKTYLQRPDSVFLMAAYRDKYGPLGKISVMVGRKKQRRISLDVWVLSCRAFSRKVEQECLGELFRRFDVDEIEFDFESTAKNGPLREFLMDLLGEPPRQKCVLHKEHFMSQHSKSFQKVLEASNG